MVMMMMMMIVVAAAAAVVMTEEQQIKRRASPKFYHRPARFVLADGAASAPLIFAAAANV